MGCKAVPGLSERPTLGLTRSGAETPVSLPMFRLPASLREISIRHIAFRKNHCAPVHHDFGELRTHGVIELAETRNPSSSSTPQRPPSRPMSAPTQPLPSRRTSTAVTASPGAGMSRRGAPLRPLHRPDGSVPLDGLQPRAGGKCSADAPGNPSIENGSTLHARAVRARRAEKARDFGVCPRGWLPNGGSIVRRRRRDDTDGPTPAPRSTSGGAWASRPGPL